jgi:hypothetical protein
MNKNLLVCGGLPKSATTFLHTEISNYKNVFTSRIKESYLFERGDFFIDLKLKTLQNEKIYLDFTPEYIFNKNTLIKIEIRRINCFFVLREYHEYRRSLEKYLSINSIKNDYLLHMTESNFLEVTKFVTDNFLSFKFEDIRKNAEEVILKIQKEFRLDFGEKISNKINKNASGKREHFTASVLYNHFQNPMKLVKSALLGIV